MKDFAENCRISCNVESAQHGCVLQQAVYTVQETAFCLFYFYGCLSVFSTVGGWKNSIDLLQFALIKFIISFTQISKPVFYFFQKREAI